MRKLLSFVAGLAVFATMLPAAVFAGGGSIWISERSGSPSGYIVPGRESIIDKFQINMGSFGDVEVEELTVRVQGDGIGYINDMTVENLSGSVVDRVTYRTNGYYTFDMGDRIVDAMDDWQLNLYADISSGAPKTGDFKIVSMDVEGKDTVTGEDYHYAVTLNKGFNFGGYFSADAAFSNLIAGGQNTSVAPGTSGKKVHAFYISNAGQSIYVDGLTFKAVGSGAGYVNNPRLYTHTGSLVDSGTFSSNNTVKFDVNRTSTGHRYYVTVDFPTHMSNGLTVGGQTIAADLEDINGNHINVSDELPINDNSFTVSSNVVVPNGPVHVDYWIDSSSPKDVELAKHSSTKVFTYGMQAESHVEMESMDFYVHGNLWNRIKRVDLYDQNYHFLGSSTPVGSGERFEVDFSSDYTINGDTNYKFHLYAVPDDDAPVGYTGYVSLQSADYEEDSSSDDLPVSGRQFSVKGDVNVQEDVTVTMPSTSPKNVVFGSGSDKTAMHFAVKNLDPDTAVTIKDMEVEVWGTVKDHVSNLKWAYQSGTFLETEFPQTSGVYKFSKDVVISKGNTKYFKINVDLDGAKSGEWGQVKIKKLVVKDANGNHVDVNYLPLYGNSFSVITSSTFVPNPVPDPVVITPIPVDPVDPDDFEQPFGGNEENPFSDISDFEATQLRGKAAIALSAQNIIRGYLVSTDPLKVEFRGWRQLNRAEAVKFVINSLQLPESKLCDNRGFPDAPTGEWYSKYMCTALNKSIVRGFNDGKFRPAQKVKKAEFLKMLVVAHGLDTGLSYNYNDIKTTDWFSKYAGISQQLDLFPGEGSKFNGNKVLNRWETAVAIYKVLEHVN
jgi:hypothetical protein